MDNKLRGAPGTRHLPAPVTGQNEEKINRRKPTPRVSLGLNDNKPLGAGDNAREEVVDGLYDSISKSDIWDSCLKEAQEQDSELATNRDKNLETMLLFAGLFSAVLTAFLAGSVSLLDPDPSTISIALLLSIAQSQQRLEAGTPDRSSPPVTIPPFEPSKSARWINILWFLSLVFSLFAATLAIMAKEWLRWFLSYDTRVPRKYVLERQRRYEGLGSWWAVGFIDFIPIILHISLFLFTLGLIIRLWVIDHVVAAVVTIASGVTGLIWIATVVLGATIKLCPFKGTAAGYFKAPVERLKELFQKYMGKHRKDDSTDEVKQGYTSLKALQWFFDFGRDPDEANAVYRRIVAADTSGSCSHVKALLRLEGISNDPEYYFQVLKLGTDAIQNLEKASNKSFRALWDGFEHNLTRHAIALSDIFPYAIEAKVDSVIKQLEESNSRRSFSKLKKTAKRIRTKAYDALKIYWQDEHLKHIVPSEYAGLTTAELILSTHAIDNPAAVGESTTVEPPEGNIIIADVALASEPLPTEPNQAPAHSAPTSPALPVHESAVDRAAFEASGLILALGAPALAPQGPQMDTSGHVGIPMTQPTLQEPNYRKIFAEALGRASVMIFYHLNRQAPLVDQSLLGLLTAIQKCERHYKTGASEPSFPITVKIPIGGELKEHKFDPRVLDVEYGLMGGLITLIGITNSSERIQVAAIDAMTSAAPMLVQQWVASQSSTRHSRSSSGSQLFPGHNFSKAVPKLTGRRLNEHVISQLKHFLEYINQLGHWAGIRGLSHLIIEALDNRFELSREQNGMYQVLSKYPQLPIAWIDWVNRDHNDNSQNSDKTASRYDRISPLLPFLMLRPAASPDDTSNSPQLSILAIVLKNKGDRTLSHILGTILPVISQSAPDPAVDIPDLIDDVASWVGAADHKVASEELARYLAQNPEGLEHLHSIANASPSQQRGEVALALYRLMKNVCRHDAINKRLAASPRDAKLFLALMKMATFICNNPHDPDGSWSRKLQFLSDIFHQFIRKQDARLLETKSIAETHEAAKSALKAALARADRQIPRTAKSNEAETSANATKPTRGEDTPKGAGSLGPSDNKETETLHTITNGVSKHNHGGPQVIQSDRDGRVLLTTGDPKP